MGTDNELDELRRRREQLKRNSDITLNNMEIIANESYRVADVAHNSRDILSDLDKEFEEKTGLKGKDIAFLFAAIGLQLLRIYLVNELTRTEPAGAKNKLETKLHEFQDKVMGKLSKLDPNMSTVNRPYYASTKQILTTSGVPYDAQETLTAKSLEKMMNKDRPMEWDFDLDEFINEMKLPLFKGANHRFATIAHDPIIGLVLGTANIMTNTITCVKSPLNIGGLELPVLTTNHVIYTSNYTHPVIGTYGSTTIMLGNMVERIIDEPVAFVAALIKQIIHIGTDMYTTCGIQFPGANLLLTNTNVEKITSYIGWGDIVKIGTSAKIAELINAIISTLHTLVHDSNDGINPELYSVKTRKIILYSNAIATGSNVIWVGANVAFGDKSQVKNLDIGGLMVLLKRLYTDTEYIRQIKEEFVLGGFKKMIQGEDLRLEEPIWD